MQGLRLGTRGSALALAQARKVAAAIETAQRWPDGWVQIVEIKTTGDKVQDRPLAEIGGKGLWTKELDRALLEEEVDFCVHSMKDVESIRPKEIHIAAVRPRGDVRDRLIGAASIDELKKGAVVGTSSPRRKAQLLRMRPDLQDRDAARQCRNAAQGGRIGQGRRDPAVVRGAEAARHRRRHRDPDRGHPSRARTGGHRDRVPEQRHPHPERAEHREQPDHLSIASWPSGRSRGRSARPARRPSQPSACSRTAICGCVDSCSARTAATWSRTATVFDCGELKAPEELARSLLAKAPEFDPEAVLPRMRRVLVLRPEPGAALR